KENKVASKDVIAQLKALNIDISNHMSMITEKEIAQLDKTFKANDVKGTPKKENKNPKKENKNHKKESKKSKNDQRNKKMKKDVNEKLKAINIDISKHISIIKEKEIAQLDKTFKANDVKGTPKKENKNPKKENKNQKKESKKSKNDQRNKKMKKDVKKDVKKD